MDIDCKHKLGQCPWACEGYIDYCVAEKQNPIAYYATKAVTEVTKQKEDYLVTAFENVGINPNIIIEQDALINKLQSQLNAVRELHKPTSPKQIGTGYVGDIDMCSQCKSYYPCLTIQYIEKELK